MWLTEKLDWKGLTKLGYLRQIRRERVHERQKGINQIVCRPRIIYRPYPDILLEELRIRIRRRRVTTSRNLFDVVLWSRRSPVRRLENCVKSK
jgi:hypothetical protein